MSLSATLIGCGKIGSELADDPKVPGVYTHAAAYSACPGTTLVAVCDADEAKAKACAARWGVARYYSNAAQMLAELRPELVSICTPDATHYSLAKLALSSPNVQAVLVEKPLALSTAEAQELVELAEARDIKLAVNYSRRYSPGHQWLRTWLGTGGLGMIQAVNGYYTKGLLHNGSHWLDLARFLFGDLRVAQVFAPPRAFAGDLPGDPSETLVLHSTAGVSLTLHGLDAAAYTLFEMDIVGLKGRVRIVDSGHMFETSCVEPSRFYTDYQMLGEPTRRAGELQDVTLHAVEDLVASVSEARSPLCSGNDALEVLRLVASARSMLNNDDFRG